MKNKSFTLIELLVVIVIIGILAGVIMISTSSSIDKANIAKLKVFSEGIKSNLMLNLVSEWKLDEGLGVIVKDSWGGNNGTLSADTMWQQGNSCISRQCLEIGNAKYALINHSNDLNFNDNFTIEFWINPKEVSGWKRIVLKDGSSSKGWLVGFQNGSYLFFTYSENGKYGSSFTGSSSGYRSSDFAFEINNFYHVIVSNRSDFYINSEKIKTVTGGLSSWYTPGGNNLYIGASNDSMNGMIDEVRVYNVALSQSQIKQNYIAGLNSMLSNGNMSKQEYNERIGNLAYDK